MQEQTLNDYKNELLKVSKKRNHRIKNSILTIELIRELKRNNIIKGVSESLVEKIIRTVNKNITTEICEKGSIHITHIGTFYIKEIPQSFKYKNKNGYIAKSVDWKATYKLWFENKDMEQKKFLVRRKVNNRYKVCWNKNKFKNYLYYSFKINRGFYNKIQDYLNNNELFVYNTRYEK